VDDDRESPTYVLWEELLSHGAEVSYFDPLCPVVRPTREHSQFAGIESVEWDEISSDRFDAAIISTAHDCVDHDELAQRLKVVVDTRGICGPAPSVVRS
jgi:UDP-N-acetyl-D-glucosamine dehydrogenase